MAATEVRKLWCIIFTNICIKEEVDKPLSRRVRHHWQGTCLVWGTTTSQLTQKCCLLSSLVASVLTFTVISENQGRVSPISHRLKLL